MAMLHTLLSEQGEGRHFLNWLCGVLRNDTSCSGLHLTQSVPASKDNVTCEQLQDRPLEVKPLFGGGGCSEGG